MTSLTKEEDFLEADQTIPGQKYVCLSFVSPEDILEKKDIFFNHKFLETIAKQYDLKHEDLIEKYKDFLNVMVIDETDAETSNMCKIHGVEVKVAQTVMRTDADKVALAEYILRL